MEKSKTPEIRTSVSTFTAKDFEKDLIQEGLVSNDFNQKLGRFLTALDISHLAQIMQSGLPALKDLDPDFELSVSLNESSGLLTLTFEDNNKGNDLFLDLSQNLDESGIETLKKAFQYFVENFEKEEEETNFIFLENTYKTKLDSGECGDDEGLQEFIINEIESIYNKDFILPFIKDILEYFEKDTVTITFERGENEEGRILHRITFQDNKNPNLVLEFDDFKDLALYFHLKLTKLKKSVSPKRVQSAVEKTIEPTHAFETPLAEPGDWSLGEYLQQFVEQEKINETRANSLVSALSQFINKYKGQLNDYLFRFEFNEKEYEFIVTLENTETDKSLTEELKNFNLHYLLADMKTALEKLVDLSQATIAISPGDFDLSQLQGFLVHYWDKKIIDRKTKAAIFKAFQDVLLQTVPTESFEIVIEPTGDYVGDFWVENSKVGYFRLDANFFDPDDFKKGLKSLLWCTEKVESEKEKAEETSESLILTSSSNYFEINNFFTDSGLVARDLSEAVCNFSNLVFELPDGVTLKIECCGQYLFEIFIGEEEGIVLGGNDFVLGNFDEVREIFTTETKNTETVAEEKENKNPGTLELKTHLSNINDIIEFLRNNITEISSIENAVSIFSRVSLLVPIKNGPIRLSIKFIGEKNETMQVLINGTDGFKCAPGKDFEQDFLNQLKLAGYKLEYTSFQGHLGTKAGLDKAETNEISEYPSKEFSLDNLEAIRDFLTINLISNYHAPRIVGIMKRVSSEVFDSKNTKFKLEVNGDSLKITITEDCFVYFGSDQDFEEAFLANLKDAGIKLKKPEDFEAEENARLEIIEAKLPGVTTVIKHFEDYGYNLPENMTGWFEEIVARIPEGVSASIAKPQHTYVITIGNQTFRLTHDDLAYGEGFGRIKRRLEKKKPVSKKIEAVTYWKNTASAICEKYSKLPDGRWKIIFKENLKNPKSKITKIISEENLIRIFSQTTSDRSDCVNNLISATETEENPIDPQKWEQLIKEVQLEKDIKKSFNLQKKAQDKSHEEKVKFEFSFMNEEKPNPIKISLSVSEKWIMENDLLEKLNQITKENNLGTIVEFVPIKLPEEEA